MHWGAVHRFLQQLVVFMLRERLLLQRGRMLSLLVRRKLSAIGALHGVRCGHVVERLYAILPALHQHAACGVLLVGGRLVRDELPVLAVHKHALGRSVLLRQWRHVIHWLCHHEFRYHVRLHQQPANFWRIDDRRLLGLRCRKREHLGPLL